MWKRRVVLLALPLALGACDAGGRETAAAPPAGSPTPSQSFIASVAPELSDCGTWTVGQGERLAPQAADCLRDAVRDRRPARLVVTAPTVEGDPITTSYAVRADGRVEVTIDSRLDRFGSGRIERQTCQGPVLDAGRPAFADCSTPQPS